MIDAVFTPNPKTTEILDRLALIALSAGSIAAQTDKYFTNTSRIVRANGDSRVTFAVFMQIGRAHV